MPFGFETHSGKVSAKQFAKTNEWLLAKGFKASVRKSFVRGRGEADREDRPFPASFTEQTLSSARQGVCVGRVGCKQSPVQGAMWACVWEQLRNSLASGGSTQRQDKGGGPKRLRNPGNRKFRIDGLRTVAAMGTGPSLLYMLSCVLNFGPRARVQLHKPTLQIHEMCSLFARTRDDGFRRAHLYVECKERTARLGFLEGRDCNGGSRGFRGA